MRNEREATCEDENIILWLLTT